jgi:hypothetical protein
MTGIAASAAGLTTEKALSVAMLAIIPSMIVTYFVGRWIGVRSQSKALFAVLAVGFFVPFIDLVISLFHKDLEPSPTGRPMIVEYYVIVLLIGTVKYTVPAVFGYWRGRVIQQSRYLIYLLRALPQESRDAARESSLRRSETTGFQWQWPARGAAFRK